MRVVQEVLQDLPADESLEVVAVIPSPELEPIDVNDGVFIPEIAVCYFYGVDEEGNLIETPVEGEKDPQEEIFVGGEYKIQPYWGTLTGGEEDTGVVELDADGNPILYPVDPIIDENGWPIWWCVALEPTLDENGNPIEPVMIRCALLPIEGEGKGDNPYVDENGNPIQTLGGGDPVIDPIVVVDYIDSIAIEVDENGNPIKTLGGGDPVIDPVVVVDYIDFIAIEVDENGNPIQTLGGGDPVIDPIVVVDYIDSIAIEVDENGNPIKTLGGGDPVIDPVVVVDYIDFIAIEVDENGNPIQTLGGGDPVIDPIVVVAPCDPIVIECRPYVDEDGNQIYTFGGVEADPVLRNLQVWLADDSAEEKAEVKITRQKDISFTVKSNGAEVTELSWDDLINQRVDFHSESSESSFIMKSGDHRYVHGKIGSDKINGGKGDDWLDGNGGKDSFKAGKGDDHILVDDAQVRSIDGGKGDDTLVLRSDSGMLDLTKVKSLKGIETIDLLSGSGNGLSLTLSAKQLFKNHVETVKILGDSFDTLALQGEHVQLQTLVADPEGFSTWHVSWKGHETTLLIDSDINVV